MVVLVPGMGDDVQAIKAGIMEIADIFVINKADHAGADRTESSFVPKCPKPADATHRGKRNGREELLNAIDGLNARGKKAHGAEPPRK